MGKDRFAWWSLVCFLELCDGFEKERRRTLKYNALYLCQAVQLIATRLCILAHCVHFSVVFRLGSTITYPHCIRAGGNNGYGRSVISWSMEHEATCFQCSATNLFCTIIPFRDIKRDRFISPLFMWLGMLWKLNEGLRNWRGLCKSCLVPSKVIERTIISSEQTSGQKVFLCNGLCKVSLGGSAYRFADRFTALASS